MNKKLLEEAKSALEKSIREDEVLDQGAEGLAKAVLNAAKDFLTKGKGTDLLAEEDKRGDLTTASADPAKTPKKSGQGYSDSSKYESRKGEDMDEEDEDEDEDEDKMPAFFKKKGKKKAMKKSFEVEEDEDGEVDATELVEGIAEQLNYVTKSLHMIQEGLGIFGDVLCDQADPSKDRLLVELAKAVSHIVTEQKEMKKSLAEQVTLFKAIAHAPNSPRIAGFNNLMEGFAPEKSSQISKADHDALFQLAIKKSISTEEMKKAVRTGDVSILDKFRK